MTDRRSAFATRLNPLYLPKYSALCGFLSEQWQPFYGYRSLDQQDAIYAQGRTKPGPMVTWAKGGESAHNYGCASDWTIFSGAGYPVWMLPTDSRWDEYRMAISQAGLEWGGEFKKPDSPHNQLSLNCNWIDVAKIFQIDGMGEAIKFIRANMK